MTRTAREPIDLSNVNYVPKEEVPTKGNRIGKWLSFFNELPDGKAALLKYNNRQRVVQVRATLQSSARYLEIAIKTRVIHGTPEIHGTDEWLLYAWKELGKNA